VGGRRFASDVAMKARSLVYYLAPPVQRRWPWVTPGSAVAVVGWLAASAGLRAYVAQFANYNATYGSIGGVILLLLWLYLTGFMLLLGAEVNAEIAKAARERSAISAPQISACAECRRLAGELAQADHRRLRPRAWSLSTDAAARGRHAGALPPERRTLPSDFASYSRRAHHWWRRRSPSTRVAGRRAESPVR
jgi:hypothetical protein